MHSLVLAAADAVAHPNTPFDIDVLTIARILGVLVPIAVGILTKKYTSDGVKAICNIVLSAVAGSVAVVLGHASGDPLTIGDFFNSIINTFLTSIVTYYGALKPTGIAGTIAEKTKNLGIGKRPPAGETKDKGKEDAGYASYGHIGWVLVVLGLILWLLLGVGTLGIILLVLGVVLLLAGGVG